jgi:uncharacterized damage-inducible protein DinB
MQTGVNMSEAQHLAAALESYFSRSDNGWFTPFTVAVDGLTAEQAAQVPALRFNSVWAVVNHVSVCQERILYGLKGMRGEGLDDDWPPPPNPPTEAAWQAARDKAIRLNRELAESVRALDDKDLDQPHQPGHQDTRRQLIQGNLVHNGYHTNEIISIRHMLGWWVEEVY